MMIKKRVREKEGNLKLIFFYIDETERRVWGRVSGAIHTRSSKETQLYL
jgi:hypothetical protein